MSSSGATLVTGAGGFIGSRVVARLVDEGLPVVTIDHAWSSPDQLREALGPAEPVACIHLGWYAGPQ